MNKIVKTVSLLAICSVSILACKQQNSTTSQQTVQAPAQTTTMHSDSFVHPAVAADPTIKDGMNITKWPNGKVKMQGNYVNGLREGEWQSFFEDGTMNSDETFVHGQTDGKVTVYYENGHKRYEGVNHNGKLEGVWTYWDEKGKMTTVDYSKQQGSH